MGPAIPVKKRKLKHDTAGASSEVVKQPSAALSPSIKVQGNGTGNEAGVGKIVGKPLAFLNDSRDLMKIPFYCMKCKADLGIAANIWSKTSKNHFTPTKYESQDLNGLTASGRTSKSPEGGDLGGCVVQPYICRSCNDIIGVKCKEAAKGKIQYQNRIFLKFAKMTFDKSPTGKPIVPHIEGIEDQAIMGQNASSPLQSQTVVEDSEQLDEDFPLPADVGGSIARLKALSGDAVDALDAQRKDIGRVSAAVESIVKDMNHMKGLMASMRSEMYARPAASLGRQDRAVYPVDELELLTANITSIGAKANEVEGLKLELEMMKRRIKRMEDANGATQTTSTLAALSQETPRQSQMARMTGPLARRSLQKPVKKASVPRDLARDAHAYRLGTINAQDELEDRGGPASTSQEGLNDNHKRPRSSTLDDALPDSKQDRADGGGASSSEHGKSQVNSSDQNIADTAPPPVTTPTELHASKPTGPFFSHHVMDTDNLSDDDYRPGSRSTAGRGTSHSSRGRGRGRGIGRGSKPRKSLTSDRFGTPPWEKPDWTAEARTNGESPAVTTSSRRNGEVSRRGTGGGSFSEPRRAQRQDSSDSKELTRDAEGYLLMPDGKRDGGSAARPRDERPRDAEGYLITAKGKRDGRSQFWADVGAGLRPHPKARNQSEPGSTNRHANIMQQIFPNGTEEGRRKSNLAQQLFSHDRVRDGKDE